MLVPPYAEDQMHISDILLVLMVCAVWAVPAALLFFFLYWTIRLAIRHEKQRLPTPREIADRERRERIAAERVAQYRPGQRRPK
ncbi:hypothetical protein AB0F88_25305 [Streptosporangium sp. NPDC023963]|uniref:hypothetical protein n=1 Tax=Streptosporangium sp. NPDC023963 TaxID=3155608 RepID=UPI003420F840